MGAKAPAGEEAAAGLGAEALAQRGGQPAVHLHARGRAVLSLGRRPGPDRSGTRRAGRGHLVLRGGVVNAAKQGPRPKRTKKHDDALTSAEKKVAKKPGGKFIGSKIRDILRGNS